MLKLTKSYTSLHILKKLENLAWWGTYAQKKVGESNFYKKKKKKKKIKIGPKSHLNVLKRLF